MFCGVLWCFVVFCGCFVVFCGCFAVFCKCFAVFPQNTQNTLKTSKNTEKHKKLTIRSCIAGVFREQIKSTVLHKTPFTKHLQNTAKHRKTPQNSHKTRFVKLRRKTPQNNNAKRSKKSQNGRNTAAIRIARIRCILQKYFRPVAKVHNVHYA